MILCEVSFHNKRDKVPYPKRDPRNKEGVSKIKIIEDLTLKMNEDGAPHEYISIWVEQMDAALNLTDYYTMVGEIVYQCLVHKGV